MAECGSTSTAPVSGSSAAYGFSAAPVPVISSPYYHVAAAATSETEMLRSGAPFTNTLPSTTSRSATSASSSFDGDVQDPLAGSLGRVANGVAADEGSA